jgi:hypothetical protein
LRFYQGTSHDNYDGSTSFTNRGANWNCAIIVLANQTVNNVVFRPMIRPASITDSTFVPYAFSNAELTTKE